LGRPGGQAPKPQSGARSAGLDGTDEPQAIIRRTRSATRADAVRLIKSRILQLKDGKVELYRAKLKLSFKYETSNQ